MVGREGGMEGGRREKRGEGRNERGDCDIIQVVIHRLLKCSISGSIHQEGKLGNEYTTKWDIPVLDCTTLLLRDIADGGMITATSTVGSPIFKGSSKVCTRR